MSPHKALCGGFMMLHELVLFFEFVTNSAWAGSSMFQLPEQAPEFNDAGWCKPALTSSYQYGRWENSPISSLFLLFQLGKES